MANMSVFVPAELRYIDCFLSFKSQTLAEDRVLFPTLLAAAGGPRIPGTFVEIGALDGVDGSNSHLFEHCFAWRGALIEANPNNFERLLRNTNGTTRAPARYPRPFSTKIHSAVCSGDGSRGETVPITVDGEQFSGEPAAMAENYIKRWWEAKTDCLKCTVAVPCRALDVLMKFANFHAEQSPATFLSLDVEGAEEKVLSTIGAARFKVIMVEMDGHDKSKDERVHRQLVHLGLRASEELNRVLNHLSRVYLASDVVAVPYSAWPTVFSETRPGNGFCPSFKDVAPDSGDCVAGRRGSWPLDPVVRGGAASFCWHQCAQCGQCHFVTVVYREVWLGQSYQLRACQWHSSCNMNRLVPKVTIPWTHDKRVETRGVTFHVRSSWASAAKRDANGMRHDRANRRVSKMLEAADDSDNDKAAGDSDEAADDDIKHALGVVRA